MSTFLKLLPLELNGIEPDDYVQPKAPLGNRENQVGVMSDDLKKLYTLWNNLEKDASQHLLDYKYSNRQDDLLLAKAAELGSKAEIVKGLFWVSFNDEFELWNKRNIGIREGFIAVWYEETSPPLPPFLRGFFGMEEEE